MLGRRILCGVSWVLEISGLLQVRRPILVLALGDMTS
jgi:hypothetical protein